MTSRWLIALLMVGVTAPAAAQESVIRVVAAPGDGIYSLLRKHGADPARHLDEFIALNQPALAEGTGLREGASYVLPNFEDESAGSGAAGSGAAGAAAPTVDVARHEIFGAEYAAVSAESKRLEGTVYYLISGHGGPDPGAMASYGGKSIAEDEYAYDVTLRLARNLMANGALVYIIVRDPDDGIRDDHVLPMDTDEVALGNLPIPRRQLDRLKQRVDLVNKLYRQHRGKYQRLIVTHVDSRSAGQKIDVFFYHHRKSRNGKRLAEHIHRTFQEKYARFQPGREYAGTFEDRSSLYVVRNTLPPTAFIEIGNLRNRRNQQRILNPDNRQALANWIFEGTLRDYESR